MPGISQAASFALINADYSRKSLCAFHDCLEVPLPIEKKPPDIRDLWQFSPVMPAVPDADRRTAGKGSMLSVKLLRSVGNSMPDEE